jgi:hypothetical protein
MFSALTTIGLFLGLTLLVIALAVYAYQASKRQRQDMTALQAQHTTLRQALTLLEAQLAHWGEAVPINVALQTILVKELTHYHTPEVDALLAKLGPPFRLTTEEETQLLEAMEARERDMGDEISDGEREAARMLPLVIKRVKRDAETQTPSSDLVLKVVSIVPKTPEDPT